MLLKTANHKKVNRQGILWNFVVGAVLVFTNQPPLPAEERNSEKKKETNYDY